MTRKVRLQDRNKKTRDAIYVKHSIIRLKSVCIYIYICTMDLYVLFERLHLNTKLCIKQT